MKVAVYARQIHEKNFSYLNKVLDELQNIQAQISLYGPLHYTTGKKLSAYKYNVYSTASELKNKVDYLISIGGDGTILDTLQLVQDSQIPVLGINTGRLGFLASVANDQIATSIDALNKGHFILDKRALLHLETNIKVFGDVNYALNELTIHKKDSSSMIIINAFLNGEYLNSYWADGLIIATPTGSTGYSLSCGGPIIMPLSGNFVITPIAPHNLNVRPFVVPDKNVISLEIEGRSQYFLATLDSRSVTIDNNVQLAVRREEFTFNIIRLNDENFLGTLRSKLNWGLDSRNW